MKRLPFRVISILTLACLMTVACAGPSEDFTKTITEEFDISSSGTVDIINKYGDVNLQTWSTNRVKIEVTITVSTRNREKADEVFERIDVNFSNSSSNVSAETEISTSKSWSRWFGNNSDKFQIDYEVHLPASVNIALNNKYGDIYVAQKSGHADIYLKYGNIRLDGIDSDVYMNLGYSKGTVGDIGGDLDLEMKYSKIVFGDIGDVEANTKYSKFEAGAIGRVRSTSSYDDYIFRSVEAFGNDGKYDDIVIGQAGEIDIDTKYTGLVVDDLSHGGDFTAKYGDIKLRNVRAGFSDIEIETSYTGVSINVESDASFAFQAYGHYCGIRHSDVEVYYEKDKSGDNEVKGYRGSRDASSKILANLSYGSFSIK